MCAHGLSRQARGTLHVVLGPAGQDAPGTEQCIRPSTIAVMDGKRTTMEDVPRLFAQGRVKMEEHAMDQTNVSVTCIIMEVTVSPRNLVTTKDWSFFFFLTHQEVSANLTLIFLKRL